MPRTKRLPNGSRTIMGSAKKRRGDDKLQLFCTPPWATRTLMEVVLPHVEICPPLYSAWEPACGKGHMSEVLAEYFGRVLSSDIRDRLEWGHRSEWLERDFLKDYPSVSGFDFIITNPPFGDLTLPFVHRALALARVGVAMFVRSQWAVEGCQRYNELFSKTPPTLMAFFSERVPLCKGRWNPDGTTATAYCWLVWVHGREPMAPFWIPPGCRTKYTKPDDRARFAAWSLPTQEAAE